MISSIVAIFARCFQVRHQVLFMAEPRIVADVNVASGYVWSTIGPDALTDVIFGERNRRRRFVHRFAEGHRCYAFFDSVGGIAAYFWFTVADCASVPVPWEFGRCASLPPHTAYVWDCFTAPAHRRRGLYRAGLLRFRTMSCPEGARTVFVVTRTANIASIAGITAAGFTPSHDYITIRIGPFVLVRRRGSVRIVRCAERFMLGETS